MSYRVTHEILPGFWAPVRLDSPAEVHLESGGTAYAGAVPAGEYLSPAAILSAIKMALEGSEDASDNGYPGVVDIEPEPWGHGRLRIRSSVPAVLVDVAETAVVRGLLGAAGAVQLGAEWEVLAEPMGGLWVSEQPVAIDEGDELDREAVETRALSGYRQRTILGPTRRVREVRIDLLGKDSIDAFRDQIWEHGERIRYLPDVSTLSGNEYVLTEPLGRFEPARSSSRAGGARYTLRVELERLVEP